MMYERFAAVYDQLMAVDYDGWAAFYLELAATAGVDVQQAVDCACGTGGLTLPLAAKGKRMIGLDSSEDMLRIASQKARSKGLQVPFVCQDMRRLAVHHPVDAVFSGCDGVNYLLTPQAVQSFFRRAFKALKPGGGLFFDISTVYKLSYTLGQNCFGEDSGSVSYIWQNYYDEETRLLQMDVTFFVKESDGRYARFCETHQQRAHTANEMLDWLKKAGFVNTFICADRELQPPVEKSERIHIAAVKPQIHGDREGK